MISIFVTVKVKPGYIEKFIEAVLDDARGSVRDEQNCYRFDVLQDREDPIKLYFYEGYRDDAALNIHRQAVHFIKWRNTVKDWIDGEPTRIQSTTIFPTNQGWEQQKPTLTYWA